MLIEKGRIDQRVGWQAKLQRENAPKTSAGMVTCPKGAAGYISNMDRFHSDTAGEEYEIRMEKIRKEKLSIEYRCFILFHRISRLFAWNRLIFDVYYLEKNKQN